MTSSDPDPAVVRRDHLEAAVTDLAEVRASLVAVLDAQVNAATATDALQQFLHVHGPTLRQAAGDLTEEVRRQALVELYKWRAQLAAQLAARKGTDEPPGTTAGPPEPRERGT